MKMNLKNMIEQLQEMGKVHFSEGNVNEAIEELYKMGYEVRFNPSTDYLILISRRCEE